MSQRHILEFLTFSQNASKSKLSGVKLDWKKIGGKKLSGYHSLCVVHVWYVSSR